MGKGSLAFMSFDTGKNLALHGRLAGKDVECHPVLGKSLAGAACWQAWRVPAEASPEPRPFEFFLTNTFEKDVELTFAAHFLPH